MAKKSKSKIKIGKDGIYDARQLGTGKMVVLGFQHMFAMFGATVTVPLLTGLSISTTLLFAGFCSTFSQNLRFRHSSARHSLS